MLQHFHGWKTFVSHLLCFSLLSSFTACKHVSGRATVRDDQGEPAQAQDTSEAGEAGGGGEVVAPPLEGIPTETIQQINDTIGPLIDAADSIDKQIADIKVKAAELMAQAKTADNAEMRAIQIELFLCAFSALWTVQGQIGKITKTGKTWKEAAGALLKSSKAGGAAVAAASYAPGAGGVIVLGLREAIKAATDIKASSNGMYVDFTTAVEDLAAGRIGMASGKFSRATNRISKIAAGVAILVKSLQKSGFKISGFFNIVTTFTSCGEAFWKAGKFTKESFNLYYAAKAEGEDIDRRGGNMSNECYDNLSGKVFGKTSFSDCVNQATVYFNQRINAVPGAKEKLAFCQEGAFDGCIERCTKYYEANGTQHPDNNVTVSASYWFNQYFVNNGTCPTDAMLIDRCRDGWINDPNHPKRGTEAFLIDHAKFWVDQGMRKYSMPACMLAICNAKPTDPACLEMLHSDVITAPVSSYPPRDQGCIDWAQEEFNRVGKAAACADGDVSAPARIRCRDNAKNVKATFGDQAPDVFECQGACTSKTLELCAP